MLKSSVYSDELLKFMPIHTIYSHVHLYRIAIEKVFQIAFSSRKVYENSKTFFIKSPDLHEIDLINDTLRAFLVRHCWDKDKRLDLWYSDSRRLRIPHTVALNPVLLIARFSDAIRVCCIFICGVDHLTFEKIFFFSTSSSLKCAISHEI